MNNTFKWFRAPKLKIYFYKPLWVNKHTKWFIDIERYGLGWKDKWSTPRFERAPYFRIMFFKKFAIQLRITADKNTLMEDEYWEQYLWTKYYCKNNIVVARNTWPWFKETGVSSWNDEYLTIAALRKIVEYNTNKALIDEKNNKDKSPEERQLP